MPRRVHYAWVVLGVLIVIMIAAGGLRVGDTLMGHDGEWLPVEDLLDTGEYETVYNLRVAEFHTYAAEWTPESVAFFVDGQAVRTVGQSPGYPMQLMLGIYEFPDDGTLPEPAHGYPKQFVIDYIRCYRPTH